MTYTPDDKARSLISLLNNKAALQKAFLRRMDIENYFLTKKVSCLDFKLLYSRPGHLLLLLEDLDILCASGHRQQQREVSAHFLAHDLSQVVSKSIISTTVFSTNTSKNDYSLFSSQLFYESSSQNGSLFYNVGLQYTKNNKRIVRFKPLQLPDYFTL
ncbi:MAG: hypothetical protein ACLFNM_03515 [Candidatus Woesearchaeota archaeon]